jgi:peptidoglycan DL-endopeptidase CwlO
MKKRLALLALPALLTLCLANPAQANADHREDPYQVERFNEGLSPDMQIVMDYVQAQLGKPYVYAASGPRAFDCSGLTLAAYRQIGIRLPHSSFTQSRMGRHVARRDVQPGDLIFMRGGDPPADLGHVGIAVSATEMISAPQPGASVHRVRIPSGVQEIRRYVG